MTYMDFPKIVSLSELNGSIEFLKLNEPKFKFLFHLIYVVWRLLHLSEDELKNIKDKIGNLNILDEWSYRIEYLKHKIYKEIDEKHTADQDKLVLDGRSSEIANTIDFNKLKILLYFDRLQNIFTKTDRNIDDNVFNSKNNQTKPHIITIIPSIEQFLQECLASEYKINEVKESHNPEDFILNLFYECISSICISDLLSDLSCSYIQNNDLEQFYKNFGKQQLYENEDIKCGFSSKNFENFVFIIDFYIQKLDLFCVTLWLDLVRVMASNNILKELYINNRNFLNFNLIILKFIKSLIDVQEIITKNINKKSLENFSNNCDDSRKESEENGNEPSDYYIDTTEVNITNDYICLYEKFLKSEKENLEISNFDISLEEIANTHVLKNCECKNNEIKKFYNYLDKYSNDFSNSNTITYDEYKKNETDKLFKYINEIKKEVAKKYCFLYNEYKMKESVKFYKFLDEIIKETMNKYISLHEDYHINEKEELSPEEFKIVLSKKIIDTILKNKINVSISEYEDLENYIIVIMIYLEELNENKKSEVKNKD